MKLLYSELAANPALYSFGYSVYGELEESDTFDEVYQQGFLPFVGAHNQPSNMVYMVRGSRVALASWKEGHYHRHAQKKLEGYAGAPLDVIVHPKEQFPITDAFISFVLTYFRYRFGRESMSEERLRAIIASPLLTHISEYTVKGEIVGYMLEVQGDIFSHVWYQAYTKKYERKFLGLSMFIDFMQRAKREGKSYAYLGITYGSWMMYKTRLGELEYFDGTGWKHDTARLKHRLRTDASRLMTYTDPWREAHGPYYKAPFSYDERQQPLRLLHMLMDAFPRTLMALMLFALILLLGAVFGLFP